MGKDNILLEWFNHPFDGIAPTKYMIYMRNVSRNFNDWRPIYYPGIIALNQFLVRNLPQGVPCQFKVAAFNNGGWSCRSEETDLIIPGEEQMPLTTNRRWRRLVLGGPLAVIDRMQLYPFHLLDILKGLEKLLCFSQQEGGVHFDKGMISEKAALTAIYAIQCFPGNPDVAAYSFALLVGLFASRVTFFSHSKGRIIKGTVTTVEKWYLYH